MRVSKKDRVKAHLRLGQYSYEAIAAIVGCDLQTVYEAAAEINGEGTPQLQSQIDELREQLASFRQALALLQATVSAMRAERQD